MGADHARLLWRGFVADGLSGKAAELSITDMELSACLMLALSNEEISEDMAKHLYEIAEPVMAMIPTECRFIP